MRIMLAKRHSLFASGVAVNIVLALTACSGAKQTPASEAAPVPVTVGTVAMSDVADTFEAGGVVQARTTATIMARILAPVREIRAGPGDRVRAGQVLIVLDGSDLAAHARSARAAAMSADQNVAAAAAEKQAADAAVVLARATHERIAGLSAKRSATAQELDDSTGALRAAEARAARRHGSRARRRIRRGKRASRQRCGQHQSPSPASRRRSTAWLPRRRSSLATWLHRARR